MKAARLCLLACAIGAAYGGANVPRSRDLANPDVSGRTLAEQVCSNCHGVTGSAISPNFPNLAAQQKTYLLNQLHELRAHSRRDPAGFEDMWGISRRLTDQQIDQLADYFSEQTLRPQPVEESAERIAAGKLIFSGGVPDKGIPPCGSCHGPAAAGQDKFPRLAGQHADYLVKQLTVFQRTNDRPEGSIMKTVAHELTRENIVDVAAYLQSIPDHGAR